ncbi:MAG: ATP-binding protein [Roseovarius sp.]|nr:ATP-binding protein [Roseovarius sp.]
MTAEFHLESTASEMSVRALLAEVRAHLRAADVPEATCGTVEIVLAEALNNIVEHAYDGAERGKIGLHARLGQAGLVCTLSDRGAMLSALHLPEGRLPEIGSRPEALPEGGFGWFLIRSLTRDIHYTHAHGGNRLTLRFDLPGSDGSDS